MEVRLGNINDIDKWMKLVELVKGNFPGLETVEALEEHRKTVIDFMNNKCAICAEEDNKIVGVLLFSKENCMLCFLAVDGKYRRMHIGRKLFDYMMKIHDFKSDITVTTYCEGDKNGVAARGFYKSLGFEEGRITEEFGSVVQEFILKL